MTTETVKRSLLSAAGTCPLLSNKVLDTIDLSNEKEEEIFECIDLDEDDELNLRLSDEDDTDQGASTKLINGQRASFRLKQDDLEENSLGAVDENQHSLEENHPIKLEDKSESVNQESILDQESNMGREVPPLMQNGPRYWSNNYHNSQRWSSPDHRNDRPRTNFKNRNQKDWYNQKYSDKNSRNYNNYSEPNGRVRNRSSYDNSNYNNSSNRKNQHNSLSPNRTPKENNNSRRSGSDNPEQMENENSPSNTDFEVKSLEEIKSEKKNAQVDSKKSSDDKSEIKDKECIEKISDNHSDESLETKDEEPTKEEEDKLLAEDDDNEVEAVSMLEEKEEMPTKELEPSEFEDTVNSKEGNEETTATSEDCKDIKEDNLVTDIDESKKMEENKDLDENEGSNLEKIIGESEDSEESKDVKESEITEETEVTEENKIEEEDLDESKAIEGTVQEVVQKNDELEIIVETQEENSVLDSAEESIKTKEFIINNELEDSGKEEDSKTVTVVDDQTMETETKESENECRTIEVEEENKMETQDSEDTQITISNVESINPVEQNESDDNDADMAYDISEKVEAELLEEIDLAINEITEEKESFAPEKTKIARPSDDEESFASEKTKLDRPSDDEESLKEVENVEEVMEIDEDVPAEEKLQTAENEEPSRDALSTLVDEIFTNNDQNQGSIAESANQVDGFKVDETGNQLEESTTIDLVDEASIDINEESIDASDDISGEKIENCSEVDKVTQESDSQVKEVEVANEQLDEQVQDNLKKKKRRKREKFWHAQIAEENLESGRTKRRSAIAATDNIRKEILNIQRPESDDESDKIPYRNKSSDNHVPRPLSPPTFKRSIDELEDILSESVQKKIKPDSDDEVETISIPESDPIKLKEIPSSVEVKITSDEKREIVTSIKADKNELSNAVRKISQQDVRTSLKKLTKEELEALLIQKCIECMTNKSEIGKLREQARAANRNLESTRARCQLLAKQVEGFEIVLKKIAHDKNTNSDKYLQPIKINRSVGLQVNFVSPETGVQNLRSLQASKFMGVNNSTLSVPTPSILTSTLITNPIRSQAPPPPTLSSPPVLAPPPSLAPAPGPRKGIRTRPPMRPPQPQNRNSAPLPPVPGLVLHDPNKRMSNIQNQNNVSPMPIPVQAQMPGQKQNVVSTNLHNTPTKATNVSIHKPSPAKTISSDFIDLTDEEDKVKVTPGAQPVNVHTPPIINDMQNKGRFQRMLQTTPISLPSNVTLSSPVRLMQPGQTPPVGSTLVNNVTTGGRSIAYIMQNGVPKPFVLASNPSPIRQVNPLAPRSMAGGTINYRQALPTIPGQTIRLLSPPGNTLMLRQQHPAPLPVDTSPVESNPAWKLLPPAPSLNIKKDESGIILSWRMIPDTRYADVASYQLYAYTEIAGSIPSTAFWKKVGDVRALRLPMAVTLTQFSEGNNYYFAVRAVDAHSRLGPYSRIVNISL